MRARWLTSVAHGTPEHDHAHGHGGPSEIVAHDTGPGAATMALTRPPAEVLPTLGRRHVTKEQRHAIFLGTLYALGHATVVLALGLLALAFGAVLPDWVDPIMGRIVGFTLLLLGLWVIVSLYRYVRYGDEFRLRSRWMPSSMASARLASVRRAVPWPRARRDDRDDLVWADDRVWRRD